MKEEMATILSKMLKLKPPPNSEGEQGPNRSQNLATANLKTF